MEISIRQARPDDAAGIIAVFNPIIESGLYTTFDTSFTVEAERAYINGLTGRDILHVAISSTFDGPTENQVVNVLLARNQAASDSDALYHNLNRTLNVIHTTIANPAQSANQAIVDTSQPASHRRLIYRVQTQAIKSLCNFCPWLA
jgi:hypothetical protein